MSFKDRKYNIVIDYIKEKLKRGELKLGDKLPPERVLAQKLNVSRATVSEAIKIMEIIGFIESTQGGGNYIYQNLEKTFYNPLSSIFLMTEGVERNILEFRRMIEVQAIEACVERITQKEIDELVKTHKKLQESEDEEEMARLDKEFHDIIAKSSKNPFVVGIFRSISEILEESIKISRKKVISRFGKKTIEERHENILRAIEARDKAGAKRALEDHLKDIDESLN